MLKPILAITLALLSRQDRRIQHLAPERS